MDPDTIELKNLSKMFAYSQLASEIDSCDDRDTLRNIAKSFCKLYYKPIDICRAPAKSFCKLYYKQQETMQIVGLSNGE